MAYQCYIKNIVKSGFSSSYKILHVHWPVNNVLSVESHLHARRRLLIFKLFIRVIRLFGKKLVWTVHNLQTHEVQHPDLQEKLEKFLYRYTDGFISLNNQGLKIIKSKATNTNYQTFGFIPHPHYKNYYPNHISKEEARKRLNIQKEKFVFLFIGQIRRYKNVTELIEVFKSLNNPDAVLLIAGRVHKELEAEMRTNLANSQNIILHNAFVQDKDLQIYINCADLIVTPYKQIFNSGSVFLNLSFNKPTLAPDLWALSEIRKYLGPRWIKTYNRLTPQTLDQAMKEVNRENADGEQAPDISGFDPDGIAVQTVAFYKSLF